MVAPEEKKSEPVEKKADPRVLSKAPVSKKVVEVPKIVDNSAQLASHEK